MTGEASGRGFGPLGRRLLVAFLLVALSSVLVLTLAALVGTAQGLTAARHGDREQAAQAAAAAAAVGYGEAGGWAGVDLRDAQAVADGVGAQLVVRDADGAMRWPGRAPAGAGPGTQQDTVTAPVVVGGRPVGGVTLAFGPPASSGRDVAWGWVAGAAAVALLLAAAVAWYVSRRLTRPLLAITATARAFAGGDRAARSHVLAPGELGELAAGFDTMADEVVRAEQVRRSLAADVAHELRTPLASLQAGLEELRDGLAVADPPRLAALHDQSLRLGRVVEDLAQLSAAESAALSLRPADIDLATVAAGALDGQRPALRAAGLRVVSELAGPAPVRGDADRLHQAVGNLLANAARYGRPGDTVSLRVAAGDDVVTLSVTDTGPGIDPEDLPHVFDRLRRGRAGRSVAGSGIGLAVVRELVTAHGGTVSAHSQPGDGARFTIRLPRAATR